MMLQSRMRVLGLAFVAGSLLACSSTTLLVRSNPTGARVVLEESGDRGVTEAVFQIPNNDFEPGLDDLSQHVVYTLEGYREDRREVVLRKGRQNETRPPVVELHPLDTRLEITSTPAGAHFHFGTTAGASFSGLPVEWPEEFTSPVTLLCTSAEARDLVRAGLRITKVEMEGYHAPTLSTREPLVLKPGGNNRIDVPLRPIVTSIVVITDPPGAIVEDISRGGFGYLGETPATHNFNWEDVKIWSNKRHFDYDLPDVPAGPEGGVFESGEFDTVKMTLRISKAGYEDVFLHNVQLPVGESRTFHRSLHPYAMQVNFASDPSGVHVYVRRTTTKETWDDESGSLTRTQVEFDKHLGTTPFTLNMDESDPLEHGEQLIYRRSGYVSGETQFASGQSSYHVVLEPKKVKER